MLSGCVVVFLQVWSGSVAGGKMDVFPMCDPYTVDLQLWGNFNDLRENWQVWDATVSDAAGCIEISNPRRPQPLIPLMAPHAPELMVLEAAEEAGWIVGARTGPHTGGADDPKVLQLSTSHSNRLYVQCCLCLSDLLEKGLVALYPRQLVKYYQCILAAPQPSQVQSGRPAIQYVDFLQRLENGDDDPGRVFEVGPPPLPLPPPPDVPALQDGRSESSDGIIEDSPPVADSDASPDAGSDAGNKTPVPGGVGSDVGSNDSDATPGAAADSSDAGSEGSPSVQRDSDAEEPAADFAWPDTLEGCELRLDEFDDGIRHYRRLEVTCPIHPGCGKYRGIGARQTRHHGNAEPLAYLSVWVHAAVREGPAKHRRYNPKQHEVDAWIATH